MAGERDVVAKGATVTRLDKDFRWPGGKRIAIFFNIAFEAWSEGKGPGSGPWGTRCPRAISTRTRFPSATTVRCAASGGCSTVWRGTSSRRG